MASVSYLFSFLLAALVPIALAQWQGGGGPQGGGAPKAGPRGGPRGGARNGARAGPRGGRGGARGGNMMAFGMERCNPGWTSMIYGFGGESVCVLIPEEKATFVEAMNFCEHIDGARLVEVQNPMINGNLKNAIMTIKPGVKAWIGLWDVEMQGMFKWVHDKFAFYTNFAPGKGQVDIGKNCVYTDQNGVWYDDSCSARHHFICMKK